MSTSGELACTYAALILHDDGIPVTAEKIAKLVKAANITVESYWPSLFARLCEKRNIDDLVLNAAAGGGGGGGAAVEAPVAASASAPAVEEKKEEPKDEDDEDMELGFSIFDD